MHYLQQRTLNFYRFNTKPILGFVQSTDKKFVNLLENTLHNQIHINVAINVLKPSNQTIGILGRVLFIIFFLLFKN